MIKCVVTMCPDCGRFLMDDGTFDYPCGYEEIIMKIHGDEIFVEETLCEKCEKIDNPNDYLNNL